MSQNSSQKYYFIYILICENNSLYTGYTTDLTRRFQEHLQGTRKCKFTRSFKPLAIAQSWQINGDKTTALRIERFIKKLPKSEKEQLIKWPAKLLDLLLKNGWQDNAVHLAEIIENIADKY